ncbi:right-handed parallel beta-helix repeat-containing protein [Actinomadura sp. 9N215]|uniref:right-handed parallel beta-helix repeat-containing protein n=1 Tax=Actinomadura sp. 9N215 TaxID=3375150 RepID=UPI003787BDDA
MNDVTTFGAIGDGIADDAPAIQSALDAGGWVYVPAGTYRLESMLRIGARTRLTLAPGAHLVRAHDDVIVTNTPAGGTVEGGYSGAPGGLVVEGGIWDVRAMERPTYSGAIAIAHASDVLIRDVTVWDVPGWHAIEINACQNVKIRDCAFAGFWHSGDRAYSEAIQLDAMTSTGVYPWGGPYDGTACDDVSITGCRFGASGTTGTQAWPRAVGSHNLAGPRQTNIRVAGNIIDSVTDCGIQAVEWERALIAGNQVWRSEGEGIAVCQGSMYVDVHDNQIFDSGRSGIWLNDDVTQVGIRGNTIIGSGRAANNTHYGIRGSSTVSWVIIAGNKVRRRSSGNHAAYGLSLTSTVSKVVRYGNDFRTSGVSGSVDDLSTSPVVSAVDAV